MKKLLAWVLRLLFRFRAFGVEALNTPGPVLLVPNHVSWLDWLILGACLEEDWRFVTSSAVAETSWLHRWIMVNRRTFPIDPMSPYAVRHMADYLSSGGRLVLFAEGRISSTGHMMKLLDGTGFLLHKTRARVVLAYLRGANRIPWVRHSGWTEWFHPVTLQCTEVMDPPRLEHVTTMEARRVLSRWVYDRMIEHQFKVEMEFGETHPLTAVANAAAHQPGKVILEDMSHTELTFRRLMTGVRLLRGQWEKILCTPPDGRVGVLMPNVNATPVILLSLWAACRVPAILNFSTGMTTMLNCVKLAGLEEIITSRQFLDRAKIDPKPLLEAGVKVYYIEDIRSRIRVWQRMGALCSQMVRPAFRDFQGDHAQSGVILFTSGSEGMPKGVELTVGNLLANIRQMLVMIDLQDHDRVFNVLPMFHSFGLTVGTLLPLMQGVYTFVYPSPLHYRIVPAAVYDRQCTVMFGTNTFLKGYARKAHPYDFRTVRYLFAGAEKIQESTFDTYARKFGVRILEGYGATECSPCITVNTPMAPKQGSAGRLLPCMEARVLPVEDLETGGRLQVRGPNVMKQYLNKEANRHFQKLEGWYDTGDIAHIDEDGFVYILGRMKRFAKVSGEMVSLTAVEEALDGMFPQYGIRCQVAVVSRHDDHKGEVLVAVVNDPKLTLEQIRSVLKEKGFSNLCVPREVIYIRDIPKLGTGKTDHRTLQRELARLQRVEGGEVESEQRAAG